MAIHFDLILSSGNAVFDPDTARPELARILRALADRIENGSEGKFRLDDLNGNCCGFVILEVGDGEA